jgi:hypothetical protein
MPRNTYRPEPGTKEHDRQRERQKGRARREVRKIDRAIQDAERMEVRGPVLEVFRTQRALAYALLA